MIPTVGRIVHLIVAPPNRLAGEHVAAIITRVTHSDAFHQTLVDLTIFPPQDGRIQGQELFGFVAGIPQDTTAKIPGTWHEPERV